MKPKDPTAPKHAHYHEHDPLPRGCCRRAPPWPLPTSAPG